MGTFYQTNQPDMGVVVPEEFNPLYAGVNAGAMFMNLELMRSKEWTDIWMGELNSGLFSKEDYLLVFY
jgi:hypothetical protein